MAQIHNAFLCLLRPSAATDFLGLGRGLGRGLRIGIKLGKGLGIRLGLGIGLGIRLELWIGLEFTFRVALGQKKTKKFEKSVAVLHNRAVYL